MTSNKQVRENIALIGSDEEGGVSFRYDTSPYKKKQKKKSWVKAAIVGIFLVLVAIAFIVATPLAVLIERRDPNAMASGLSENNFAHNLKLEDMMEHLKELQKIADNSASKSRSIANAYNSSAEYVAGALEAAGYQVQRQPFKVFTYENLGGAVLNATFQSYSASFIDGVEFSVMRYSDSGQGNDLQLFVADASGCEASHFDEASGQVALIIYDLGNCSFYQRAVHAKAKGVAAVIMMRDANHTTSPPPTSRITNSDDPTTVVDIPVFGATHVLGLELEALFLLETADLKMGFEASTRREFVGTYNVLAYTEVGDPSSIIVVGSHLDSVPAGPGINDNGSGSALNLALALLFEKLRKTAKAFTESKILFAFWGAEEIGLLGSEYFVSQLGKGDNPAISDIALNLNYDMVASPNYIRGVYNGSGAESEIIRNKCRGIQMLFEERFRARNLPVKIEDFSGRSDYGPFIAKGIDIPAGGLFTGAEGIKTVEDQQGAGGVAFSAYDPCYHQACDTIDNINQGALSEMGDAGAYALQKLVSQTDVRGYLEVLGSQGS